MKAVITTNYHWKRNDGKKIRKKHVEALKEAAEERMSQQMVQGIREGELHDNIIMDDKDEKTDGVDYSGWWQSASMTNMDEDKPLDPVEHLQEKLSIHLEAMQGIVERYMPYKGDREEDSQKVCLTNILMHLEHNINGIEAEDFETEDE